MRTPTLLLVLGLVAGCASVGGPGVSTYMECDRGTRLKLDYVNSNTVLVSVNGVAIGGVEAQAATATVALRMAKRIAIPPPSPSARDNNLATGFRHGPADRPDCLATLGTQTMLRIAVAGARG